MRVQKHFRTSQATIDYIIADLTLNRISNKETYFMICVGDRLKSLNDDYQNRVDKALDLIIRRCSYDNYPIDIVAKIMYNLSKTTNALTKGLLSLL